MDIQISQVLEPREQPVSPLVSSLAPANQYNLLNRQLSLKNLTTAKAVYWNLTSTGTIDLTSAPAARDSSVTISLDGLRPIIIDVEAPAGNSGSVQIAQGASNGYPFNVTLDPGEKASFSWINSSGGAALNGTQVSATVKTLDVTIGAGDSVRMLLVFG